MDKIIIIGPNGAGKSVLAKKIGNILQREVTYLDKLHFKKGWIAATQDEWQKTIENLILKDKWIIDGNYNKTMDLRMAASDTIIFLNFSKLLCLFRAFKRIFDRTQPFSHAEGNLQKISWRLIESVIFYLRKKIFKKLKKYKDTKNIVILKNDREVEQYLITLEN